MDLDELTAAEDPHQRPVGAHLDALADQVAGHRVEDHLAVPAGLADQVVDDGLAHFPCVYDTFPGGFQYWNYGFAYSNMTDSITQGFGNQYSAITGKGHNNSSQYLVAYGATNKVMLKGKAVNQPVNGFYIANTAYAWHSMANGARFLKRVIDERIKLPLSQQWKDANSFRATLREGQLVLETVGPRLIASSDPDAIAV